MAKRDSIRGRGADIFLAEEPVVTPPIPVQSERPSQPATPPETQPATFSARQPQSPAPVKRPASGPAKKQRRSKAETVKLTVYIRPELDTRLDQLWLQRRMQDVNAQKSLLVEEALQLLFERETAAKQ